MQGEIQVRMQIPVLWNELERALEGQVTVPVGGRNLVFIIFVFQSLSNLSYVDCRKIVWIGTGSQLPV
jgi:hypothetical protein